MTASEMVDRLAALIAANPAVADLPVVAQLPALAGEGSSAFHWDVGGVTVEDIGIIRRKPRVKLRLTY